ncbi:hypothetical protein BJ508DRAFT_415647 [Ascobolus immersus RN42]|uniref:Uncharacterized protein n=1 Tax=Ascobolus immersus RN42 TaxID=1160509 RepID=A0A3N4IDL6_ASCIM|nr:hypothetical protein BJ508DRAFT_415647 [Ascobolus immersus RN42]
MKITHLTLAGIMATTAIATPFWERDHERWDNRHCRPRTVVETRWRARTTITRKSTRTKTVTVKNHWNPRPNVITTTKLQTITASGGTITVSGKPTTTTITVPGEGDVTTVTIPTTVTLPAEGEITTVTVRTTVTLPGEETTSTLTVPGEGEVITVTVPTTVTVPAEETTITVPGEAATSTVTEKATTVTIPGDEVTTTTTITEPVVPC